MGSTNTQIPAAEYRTDRPRADGWTGERQTMFLMALASSGMVTRQPPRSPRRPGRKRRTSTRVTSRQRPRFCNGTRA